MIAAAAACAAAVLAVFAAGFAFYAALEPLIGSAGAAAVLAAAAALGVGLYALVLALSARAKQRDSEQAGEQLRGVLMNQFADAAAQRPLIVTGLSLLGGLLAARDPRLTRDLIALAASITPQKR